MTPYIKIENLCWMLFLTLLATSTSFAQRDVEKWKLQLAVGVNNPIDRVKNDGYYTKYINFPTVNIGVQHMFSENLGAKLDFGYNRSSDADASLPFKLNYSRINAQAVYDFKELISFLPSGIGVVGHAGPGISMTKPLGDFVDNTYTYLNLLGGLEIHYRVAESYSFFVDGSYAFSSLFKNKYDYEIDGFSFRGDLMYVVVGVSVSLSGCRYC
jgi:hypothetical protein